MSPRAGLRRSEQGDRGTAGDRGWGTQQCHPGRTAGLGPACWVDAPLGLLLPTAPPFLEFHGSAQGAAVAGQVSLPGRDPLQPPLTAVGSAEPLPCTLRC